jgi:hypothetical protein
MRLPSGTALLCRITQEDIYHRFSSPFFTSSALSRPLPLVVLKPVNKEVLKIPKHPRNREVGCTVAGSTATRSTRAKFHLYHSIMIILL